MNVKKLIESIVSILLLTGVALTSCSEEDQRSSVTDGITPVFSAAITTRAADASWHTGDHIGITMLQTDCNDVMNDRHNCKYYTPSGDGIFTFSDRDHVIYYPLDGCDVDFVGYYPYCEQLIDQFVYHVDITNQENLTYIDLMTFDRYCGASMSKPEVQVDFKHRLTKLQFRFTKENTTITKNVKSLTIDGMYTSAGYHLIDNSITTDPESRQAIAIPVNEMANGALAIVLPRAQEEGVSFTIQMDDETEYEVKMDPELELKSGTQYVFNVLLREKDMPAVISATIVDWKEGDESNHEIELVALNPEPGDSYGFVIGDKITLYHELTELTTFEYDGELWFTSEPLYWNVIGDGISDKVTLKALFTRSEALNETQLPEVMLAKQEVTRYETLHFLFHIVPSKLVFNLRSESTGGNVLTEAELREVSVKLEDLITEFTLEYAEFTSGTKQGTVDLEGNIALIVPQKINGDMATLTFNGREYKITLEEEMNFEAGKVYTFNVNITRTAITSFTAYCTDWILGGEIDIDATPIVLEQPSGTSEGFEPGDEVVVYYDGNEITAFRYDGNQWSATTPAYWENLGDGSSEKITLQAMYVRKSKTDDTQLDEVMLAEKEVTRFGGLSFEFNLVPSKIIFEITSSDGTFTEADVEQVSVRLLDLVTGYTLSGGKFSAAETRGNVNVVDFAALIIPQKKSGKLAELTLNNNVYAINLPAEMEFEAGKSHKIAVNFNKNQLEFLSMSYVDWTEGGGSSLTATAVNLDVSVGMTTNFKEGNRITLYSDIDELATYEYTLSGWRPVGNALYWENVGNGYSETVPIKAVFTRTAAADDSQLAEVFLASTTATRFKGVALAFNLVPAKVVFTLTSESINPSEKFESIDLAEATIVLPSYENNYTLSHGVFTKYSGTGDISVKDNSALIIPQKKTGDIALVTLAGNQYRVHDATGIEFVAGKTCRIMVNITKTDIVLSASYADWEDDESSTLTPFLITGETENFSTGDKFTLYYDDASSVKTVVDVFEYRGNNVWKPENSTYWEGLDAKDMYDFYAISTLKEALTSSNQMDDVMYAEYKNVTKFGLVDLEFKKKTARVVVVLTSNFLDPKDLPNATITLPQYTIGAKYDELSFVEGNTTGDITATKVNDQTQIEWTALIEKQEIDLNADLFKIDLGNGSTYTIKADKKYSFEEGKSHTFTIKINKSDVEFSASYSDWTTEEEKGLETELE